MAKIILKKSAVASKVPVVGDLDYGELAVNYTDGKLYYKKSDGTTIDYFPSVTNTVTPSGTQTLTNKTLSSPTVTGNITGDGAFTGLLKSLNSSGDEGGEILLAKAQTNTTIAGTGVTIDVYQNKIRFFEQGGSARGFYIDITAGANSAGTNLASGGGTTTNALTIGTGLTGTSFNGSSAVTIAIDSTVTTLTGTQTLTNKTLTIPTIDNIKLGYSTTATAAGTTTLTATSNHQQQFTGTTTQTIALPVTSTLVAGVSFQIENLSTGNLTVNSSGGNLVGTVYPGLSVLVTCIGTTLTTAADWDFDYVGFNAVSGTGSAVLATAPSISNLTITGTLTAGGGTGTSGQVLTSSGTGISWSAVSVAPRSVTIADGTSISMNADTTDIAVQANTQAAGTLTVNAPTGTPVNGQRITLRLTSTNVQTFNWSTATPGGFLGGTDVSLPTTSTGGGKKDYYGFVYDSTATKWHLIAKATGY